MPVIEFEGKTTEEAIETACNQLHIPKDELKFQIISTGTGGIFGLLTGRKARVKVTVEEKISSRTEKKTAEETNEEAVEAVEDTGTRPEPVSEQPRREATDEKKPERRKPRRPEKKRSEPDRPKQEPRSTAAAEDLKPSTLPGPDEEFYEGPEDDAMKLSREVLEGILSRIPIEATVTTTRINNRIILNIEGGNSGLLIGKKGATLDAFQFLVNKIVNREKAERNHIIVDTGDYRQRRHDSLMALALRLADKARRIKRPVSINALSAQERRIIHLALKNEHGVITRSKGDGSYKRVVIIPN
ncbi:MAG: Jag N-terminal domain-containing protein [Deltaproteobacteria bacterium]|nr:Jag N-terminal domain-containing protein [Deltaproteobacteria bacterium]